MKRTPLVRKSPLRAKTSTLARAKTPLRARARINPVSKARREEGRMVRATDFRAFALQRSRGLCECLCGQPLREPVNDHHVFPRSHVSRRVRHEFWNRVLILQACHIAIHDRGDEARRQRTEWAAVSRLLASLSGAELAELIASIPSGATEPSATVAAYERMRHGQPAEAA